MNLFKNTTYKLYFDYDSCDTTKFSLLSSKELFFSSTELLHAIITCGMPRYYLTSYHITNSRLSELMYKINILATILEEKDDPIDPTVKILVLSPKLKYLDQSERAYLSYYVGMIFTKLISHKIFNVQYLVHLTIAELTKTISFTSKKRPDLIGYNLLTNNYSVFEAKGRINFVKTTLNNAHAQTQAIKEISGYSPNLRVANMTYFKNRTLHSYIVDPDAEGDLKLDFPIVEILKQYYLPVYELAKEINYSNNDGITKISFHDTISEKMELEFPTIILSLYETNQFNINQFKEYFSINDVSNDLIKINI